MTPMTRRMRTLVAVIAAMFVTGGSVLAQSPQLPRPVFPVKVDVVISRFQGEKKTGSLPYSMLINTNAQRTSLRMGVDVPAGTTTTTREGVTTTQPTYQNVGTNIDCSVTTIGDGKFDVYVNVVDRSIFTGDPGDARPVTRSADPAAFRQFSISNYLSMKDGQTVQFTMATDKITGETLKIDVVLTVIK
jgi:hypothetical protein